MCQQTVPDICDESMNKRDKESGPDWSHHEESGSYSCGSPGGVDSWQRIPRRGHSLCKDPRAEAYLMCLGNRKVDCVSKAVHRGNYMELPELKTEGGGGDGGGGRKRK